jgi:FixJ family two-component response regulator
MYGSGCIAGRPGQSTSQATPTVFVVDGDASVRRSLELLLSAAAWRLRSFASAEEFLAQPRLMAPSCLVLDVTLPDLPGLDLQKRVLDRTEMPIIFMTDCCDLSKTVQAMKAGAVEFLTKPCRDEVLLSAIRHAIDLSYVGLGREVEVCRLRALYAALSPREREVMSLVVTGRLNKQVSAQLCISEITVKAHRGSMMRKMHAESLADLVNKAMKLRL